MTDNYKNCLNNTLVRDFVPCRRIVASSEATGVEFHPDCRILHTFSANDYPVCHIEKGGFIHLDFGMELTGGMRMVTSGNIPSCRICIRFGESCSETMNKPNRDHIFHDAELPLPGFASVVFGNNRTKVYLDKFEREDHTQKHALSRLFKKKSQRMCQNVFGTRKNESSTNKSQNF